MQKIGKWTRRGIIALFVVVTALLLIFCHENEQFFTVNLNDEIQSTAAPELASGTAYNQTIPCLFDNVKRIGLQFANYGSRANSGKVSINVFSAGKPIGHCELDASQIPDGAYQYVGLDRAVSAGEVLEIQIFSDSPTGQGVTIWTTNSPILSNSGATLTVNGDQWGTQLNTSFEYRSPKLSKWFPVLFGICCILMIATGVPRYYYELYRKNGRGKRLALYCVLLLGGAVIVSLRYLQFISTPAIYAEDGYFLARQLREGIRKTVFMTRSGGPNDFSNTGVYILLWIASKINMLFNGYSLAAFPFWNGVVANLYIAFTAVVGFRAFELVGGKKAGIVAYVSVIFLNLGELSTAEVLGRSLNTQFLWIATVAFLLIIQFVEDNAFSFKSIFIGLGCLVGSLTLPVCYVEVGVFLAAEIWRCIKDKAWKKRLSGNIILIIALIVGFCMLPQLLTSEGAGAAFEYKPESTIEFFLARHMLFPFVSTFYSKLNDTVTIILSLIYAAVVVAAVVVQSKKSKSICNPFAVFAVMALGACFASAFMRRTMTALFNNYSSTYPDRYYYACNILAFAVFLYAVIILTRQIKQKKIVDMICTAFVVILLAKPNLFLFSAPRSSNVYGASGFNYTFAQSCKIALEQEKTSLINNVIPVKIYPDFWPQTDFPAQFVIATAADSQRD